MAARMALEAAVMEADPPPYPMSAGSGQWSRRSVRDVSWEREAVAFHMTYLR